MFIFICKKCNSTKELSKSIIIIENGKVKTKNADCNNCGNRMQEVRKNRRGFPNLLRTEPSLTKN